MTEQFRPRGFSLLPMIVKNLLIINVLMFLAQIVAEKSFGIKLEDLLGLHYPPSMAFRPWQFITYMFLHSTIDIWHLFFNMFNLWMFGYALENVWGARRFLFYYLITGIGAALLHSLVVYFQINPTIEMMNAMIANPTSLAILEFVSQHTPQIGQYFVDKNLQPQILEDALQLLAKSPDNKQALFIARNFLVEYREYYLSLPNVIGASGAVFGILLAFGMLFPNTIFLFFFLFPIKAKYLVIIFGLIELYSIFTGANSNVAHFAHLGGMVFGFFLILYWKKKGRLY